MFIAALYVIMKMGNNRLMLLVHYGVSLKDEIFILFEVVFVNIWFMNKFSLNFMNIPKISFDNIHGKILNDNVN